MVRKRGVAQAADLRPILGVYYTFKHGMFRIGDSCKLRILFAHFLSLKKLKLHSCRKNKRKAGIYIRLETPQFFFPDI